MKPSNYTLYYSPGSASLVVHWMLIELDAPHTLALVDTAAGAQKQPEYLALNPNGVVPTADSGHSAASEKERASSDFAADFMVERFLI